eukprot:2356-Eustigmatos_ZCMA.PRE.1
MHVQRQRRMQRGRNGGAAVQGVEVVGVTELVVKAVCRRVRGIARAMRVKALRERAHLRRRPAEG